jgi:arabinofuranosyltransferase
MLSDDLILVARWAGMLATALMLVAIAKTASTNSRGSLFPVVIGLAVLALSHGVAIWAIGGLEQPLYVALLAWMFVCLLREEVPGRTPLVTGLLLALIVLTRPDGALIVLLVALGLLLSGGLSKRILRDVIVVSALPAAAWVCQLIFRLLYYGDWIPNTAYVKVSWSIQHTWDGLRYMLSASLRHAPFVILALVIAVTARPFRRRHLIVPIVVALGWAAYVTSIGGDLFPGRRHFLPVLVCGAVFVSAGWRTSILGRPRLAIQVAILVLASATYFILQSRDPENIHARYERWEWDCAKLASMLGSAFSAQAPLFAADPIGCAGYFSKLPMLDMMGLNDRHIARTRPPDFGQGYIGHELGDGRYVLARGPDLVLFCSPAGSAIGCFRSGIELAALPDFRNQYPLVNMAPPAAPYRSRVWVRTGSLRIGMTESPGHIRIPGFLFASGSTASVLSAVLSEDGRLVARIPPRAVVRFDRLPRLDSTWVPRAIASRDVTTSVRDSTVTVVAGPGGSDLFELILSR